MRIKERVGLWLARSMLRVAIEKLVSPMGFEPVLSP